MTSRPTPVRVAATAEAAFISDFSRRTGKMWWKYVWKNGGYVSFKHWMSKWQLEFCTILRHMLQLSQTKMSVFGAICLYFPALKRWGMLSLRFSKTVEMLNRFRLPPLSGNVRRLQSGIGYNNGKSHIFLCKKYNFRAASQETLPSLILAKSRGGRLY